MTGPEAYAAAMMRVRASDYQWQNVREGAGLESVVDALGALREAVLAQATATLALVAIAAIREEVVHVNGPEESAERTRAWGEVGVR